MDNPLPAATARLVGVLLLLLALLLAGCASPAGGTAGRVPDTVLYVANVGDGTITRIAGQRGRVLGPPLPAGRGPWQVAAGANGNLLVLSSGTAFRGQLTHLVRLGGPGHSSYRADTLSIAPEHASSAWLAGDGERYAAVVYRRLGEPVGAPGCRLALIDVTTGSVVQTHAPCSAREVAEGLALGRDAAGLTAYVSTWSTVRRVDGRWQPAGGRILAVDAVSGAVVGSYRAAGVAGQLILAPTPRGTGRRLYAVESSLAGDGTDPDFADRWQLVGLDPTTLDAEATFPLDHGPRAVAISPDGGHAYAVARSGGLVHVDLTNGVSRLLATVATVPAADLGGLAVTADRIYVSNPQGREVSVVERRSGRVVGSIPVGRYPGSITPGPMPPG
jgi:DNA-binding beta-propeller fold protein YncE